MSGEGTGGLLWSPEKQQWENRNDMVRAYGIPDLCDTFHLTDVRHMASILILLGSRIVSFITPVSFTWGKSQLLRTLTTSWNGSQCELQPFCATLQHNATTAKSNLDPRHESLKKNVTELKQKLKSPIYVRVPYVGAITDSVPFRRFRFKPISTIWPYLQTGLFRPAFAVVSDPLAIMHCWKEMATSRSRNVFLVRIQEIFHNSLLLM